MRSFSPEEILNAKKEKKSHLPIFFMGVAALAVIAFAISTHPVKKEQASLPPTHHAVHKSVQQKVYAVAIKINGKTEVYVKDSKIAEQVIKDFSKANLPKSDKLYLKKTYFKEKLFFEKDLVAVRDIKDLSSAVNQLMYGNPIVAKYITKKGDTLWGIARKNNMHVKEILAANPNLDAAKISDNQIIYFKRPQPKLTLVAIAHGERARDLPFDTKIVKDPKLRKGNDKVVTEGKNGTRIFTYQVTTVNGYVTDKAILSDKVAEKPVTKVITSGSANKPHMILASRDGESGGRLLWPKHGHINSPFGYRGSEFHTGIDISGSIGDPVEAAASGRVIMAGWDGNYGRCILIDHGNGMVTRYGHLSEISVNEGERVSRGDYIGAVGETGRATGPHLHFEVIVNGGVQNPLRFLN